MLETQQKIKQLKNVAVAIVRNDEGQILLVKPSDVEITDSDDSWIFPSNTIVPGSTYTETFASDVLEVTGCIVEAISLVSSEKLINAGYHYEYVECKIVCKDSTYEEKIKKSPHFKWVNPEKIKTDLTRNLNKDLKEYLGL